jgi:hypothetical protein
MAGRHDGDDGDDVGLLVLLFKDTTVPIPEGEEEETRLWLL